jgi:Holliday junction resolvase
MISNKKKGSKFEIELCKYLHTKGYWCAILNPASNGSQPFDIIAINEKRTLCVDAKTEKTDRFALSRIEENQRNAFDMIDRLSKGTRKDTLLIIIKSDKTGKWYSYKYFELKKLWVAGAKSIKLEDNYVIKDS